MPRPIITLSMRECQVLHMLSLSCLSTCRLRRKLNNGNPHNNGIRIFGFYWFFWGDFIVFFSRILLSFYVFFFGTIFLFFLKSNIATKMNIFYNKTILSQLNQCSVIRKNETNWSIEAVYLEKYDYY